jgi:hypothetical protein
MLKLRPKRDTVFFLGAGFSFSAGLPIMSKFGDESKKDYKGLLKLANIQQIPNYRHAAPMLVEAGKLFQDFQDFCKQSKTLRKGAEQNLETIFCIAEALNEAGIEHVKLAGHPYLVDNIIEKIQLWIWKIYQQCPLLNKERSHETKPEIYDRFFKFLKESELDKELTIISTNYDLIYEYLSWGNNMPCVYPVKNIKCIKAGYGNDTYIFQDQKAEEHKDKVIVCKLHGSINYFYDDKNEKNTISIVDDLGDNTPIGHSKQKNGRPALFAVDAIWKIRSQYGNSFTPAIIPPTYAKLGQQSWLKAIWNSAFDAIRHAQKIIFIGYSMPRSDGFMHALIHGAMAARKLNKLPQIYVIDICGDVHKRYKQLFNSMYEPLEPQSFDQAIENNILETIFPR